MKVPISQLGSPTVTGHWAVSDQTGCTGLQREAQERHLDLIHPPKTWKTSPSDRWEWGLICNYLKKFISLKEY